MSDIFNPTSITVPVPASQGGTAGTSVLSSSYAPKMVQVGQRCGNSGNIPVSAGTNWANFHHRITCAYGADAIQLVYPNYTNSQNFNGENSVKPNVYQAIAVSYTGGTGYAVGDIDTFAVTGTTGISGVQVMIMAVSAGVPSVVQIIDGGVYNTILTAGASPASTSGSGTGATATFQWRGGYAGFTIGIEPAYGVLVAQGAGAGAVVPVGQGLKQRPTGPTNGLLLKTSLLIPMDDFLVTDVISVDVPVGGSIGIRGSIVGGGYICDRGVLASATTVGASASSYEATLSPAAFTDMSTSGSYGTGVTLVYFPQPILCLGIPKVNGPIVLSRVDSRGIGYATGNVSVIGDFGDADGNVGWFEKSLGRSVAGSVFAPFASFGNLSNGLGSLVNSPFNKRGFYKAIKLSGASAVMLALNTNDFEQGTSAATIQLWEQQLIAEIKGLGVRQVYTITTDPWSSSTDSWATTANQTIQNVGVNNQFIIRNTALASGTWCGGPLNGGYDFFIDNRPIVENGNGSGIWKATGVANGYTGDGLHASPFAINLMAANAGATLSTNLKV